MPGQPIISASLLTAGLRTEFADTYAPQYKLMRERLSDVMEMGMPSNKLTELFAYLQSGTHPVRWPRGSEISDKNIKSVGFNVTNLDWGRRISWHENDRKDDQTRSMMDRARDLGYNFSMLHERVFFQLLTSATDTDLVPTVPNAPDRAALFSATDGDGGDRFGVSGGNVVGGAGVATAGAVLTDFFTGYSVAKQFQDTEGQPLFDDSVLDQGATVIYGAANEQVFREAFIQSRRHSVISSTGAAVTNIITESGLKATLWSTQRITNDDWYIIFRGARKKPIFQLEREGLREAFANMDNSDQARSTKIEYIQWDARYGYGVGPAYGAIKIDN